RSASCRGGDHLACRKAVRPRLRPIHDHGGNEAGREACSGSGLADVKVEWNTFRSSDVMNDALLSGTVDIVSLGVPGLMTIGDKTKGTVDVKGASALNPCLLRSTCA